MATSPDNSSSRPAPVAPEPVSSSSATISVSAPVLLVGAAIAALLIGVLGGFIAGRSSAPESAALSAEEIAALVAAAQPSLAPAPSSDPAPAPAPTGPAPAPAPTAPAPAELGAASTEAFTAATPAGLSQTGAFQLGSGPKVIEVYEDMKCSFCSQLSNDYGAGMKKAAEAGDYTILYYPMAFLSPESSTAANAVACVYNYAPDQFSEFHTAVFNLPSATVETLTQAATDAGAASADVAACIESGEFNDFITESSARANARGVQGTPTVTIDGTQIGDWPAELGSLFS